MSVNATLHRILVIAMLSMLMLSSATVVTAAASETPAVAKSRVNDGPETQVTVYFDSSANDIMSTVAIVSGCIQRCGIPVVQSGVQSILSLGYSLERSDPGVAVYIFQSSLSGIMIQREVVSWKDVAVLTATHNQMHHVFGIGNAKSLLQYVPDSERLHIDKTDMIDLKLTAVYSLWTTAEILIQSDSTVDSTRGEQLRTLVLKDFRENINEIISKALFPKTYTGERVPQPITNPRLTQSWVVEEPQLDAAGVELRPIMKMSAQDSASEYIPLREVCPESGVGGPIGWLLDLVLTLLTANGFEELQLNVEAAEEINDYVEGIVKDAQDDVVDWFSDEGFNITGYDFASALPSLLQRQMFELWALGDDLIADAFTEADDWLTSWVEQVVETPVQTDLIGLTPVFLLRLGTPINLGSDFASFGAVIRIKLLPTFEADETAFETFMNNAIFGSLNLTSMTNVTAAFTEVRKFIDVIPVLDMELAVCAFLPSKSAWLQTIMSPLEFNFFGAASMQLAFPPIDASNTERSFIEVRSWSLKFDVDASFTITVSALLSVPGVSGVIDTIMDTLSELLSASLTLTVSVTFEMSKQYVGQGVPARSNLVLDIVVGASIYVRILVVIFRGTFQVGLRFQQTSGGSSNSSTLLADDGSPFTTSSVAATTLSVYLTLYCSLYLGVDIVICGTGVEFGPWTDTWSLSTSWGSSDYLTSSADLTDTDQDGLPDAFESRMNTVMGTTYLSTSSADTDSDGLNDKLELELNTAPNVADTDVDGLKDGLEVKTYLTNPLLNDTDRDNITDGQEVLVYKTNPLIVDTDADGLSDYYEINREYDVSETHDTYGAVNSVRIGNTYYDDRTDPLNPDTDNDGLLDGQEAENGVEYANDTLLAEYYWVKNKYTSPLDADTDDDSVLWQWDDATQQFQSSTSFLSNMIDGVEVLGQYVTFIDSEGYPVVQFVKTNPVNPDTDNDSWGYLLNTDGYELALSPPTDPTNGDTDHDGLIDGREKIGPYGTGTDPNRADTDNDMLPDYEEVMLATNARDPDTDSDGVMDGEEYYKYGTSPFLNDTDMDDLTDSEELFEFYSNPLVRDSDADGLDDGEEVLFYLTDPVNADSDYDVLLDGYEVLVSMTDPMLYDTDADGLGDGDELLIYHTNPVDWDTDDDSIVLTNEFGEMSLAWGDGAEVAFGTDPTCSDSDNDGLTDGEELYLGLGSAVLDPVPLNPLSDDTDGDGLHDGEEMVIENVSLNTYPYWGLVVSLRYGSCPAKFDSDGDGLNDTAEMIYLCDPTKPDTDGDTMSDSVEVYVTHTNPTNNDTDYDDIPDNMESTNTTEFALAAEMSGWDYVPSQWPMYPTSATDSDTDDDLLPDGIELIYHTGQLNPDSNGNGVLDGMEFDADGDGLKDGEEFYIYRTNMGPLPIENGTWIGEPGGFNNPDSDGDGLSDGVEVHTYGTDPTAADSDQDGLSDGEEVSLGLNPLVPIVQSGPTWYLIAVGAVIGLAAGIGGETLVLLIRQRGLRFWRAGKASGKAPDHETKTPAAAKTEVAVESSREEPKEQEPAASEKRKKKRTAKTTKEGSKA